MIKKEGDRRALDEGPAESETRSGRRATETGPGGRKQSGAIPTKPGDVCTPKTTDGPDDTGAGEPANEASTRKVSDSVTHGGTSGHGQGEPVPKVTNIPEPTPDHSDKTTSGGSGPAPLGS